MTQQTTNISRRGFLTLGGLTALGGAAALAGCAPQTACLLYTSPSPRDTR